MIECLLDQCRQILNIHGSYIIGEEIRPYWGVGDYEGTMMVNNNILTIL